VNPEGCRYHIRRYHTTVRLCVCVCIFHIFYGNRPGTTEHHTVLQQRVFYNGIYFPESTANFVHEDKTPYFNPRQYPLRDFDSCVESSQCVCVQNSVENTPAAIVRRARLIVFVEALLTALLSSVALGAVSPGLSSGLSSGLGSTCLSTPAFS